MINTLRPVTFEWKSDKKKSGTRRGFIAQEITSSDAYWVRSGSVNSEQPDYVRSEKVLKTLRLS